MDMQALKEEILLKLTGDVTEFELSDSTLTRIINSSLREVQRYIDTFKMITVPFRSCIDLSEHNVSAVIGVRRSEGYMVEADTENSAATMDPLYASQWQLLSGMGNISYLTDYAHNYASWNTLLQIRNTTSTDLAHFYDKTANKLYINVSCGAPDSVTVLYIPRFNDVSEITSDYWNDVLVRLSVATAKITVGRVRTKFTQTNALYALDGDKLLEEGTTELNNLRTELKADTQLVYGID